MNLASIRQVQLILGALRGLDVMSSALEEGSMHIAAGCAGFHGVRCRVSYPRCPVQGWNISLMFGSAVRRCQQMRKAVFQRRRGCAVGGCAWRLRRAVSRSAA